MWGVRVRLVSLCLSGKSPEIAFLWRFGKKCHFFPYFMDYGASFAPSGIACCLGNSSIPPVRFSAFLALTPIDFWAILATIIKDW